MFACPPACHHFAVVFKIYEIDTLLYRKPNMCNTLSLAFRRCSVNFRVLIKLGYCSSNILRNLPQSRESFNARKIHGIFAEIKFFSAAFQLFATFRSHVFHFHITLFKQILKPESSSRNYGKFNIIARDRCIRIIQKIFSNIWNLARLSPKTYKYLAH